MSCCKPGAWAVTHMKQGWIKVVISACYRTETSMPED